MSDNEKNTEEKFKKNIEPLINPMLEVISTLNDTFTISGHLDMFCVIVYSAGLAGIACHEAVKASGEKQFVLETDDGRKYYFGDAVNSYLCEDDLSVINTILLMTDGTREEALEIVRQQAATIGSDRFILHGDIDPHYLFVNVKACWDDLFDRIISKYSIAPSQWPVLYALILGMMIKKTQPYTTKEELFKTSVEVAFALSKIDTDSLI